MCLGSGESQGGGLNRQKDVGKLLVTKVNSIVFLLPKREPITTRTLFYFIFLKDYFKMHYIMS